MLLSHQYIQRYCWSVVSPEDAARAQMLLELLFIRSGAFCLNCFCVSDVKLLLMVVHTLVVNCFSFSFCTFLVYFEYDSIINVIKTITRSIISDQ